MGVDCLTQDQKDWAYEMWCIGATKLQIAEALDCSERTIKRTLEGKKQVRHVLRYSPRWKKDGITFRRIALYERVCKICGREFETESYRKSICSEECRKLARRENEAKASGKRELYNRTFREKQKLRKQVSGKAPALSLAEVSRMARERGMTYGEYMVFLRECGR